MVGLQRWNRRRSLISIIFNRQRGITGHMVPHARQSLISIIFNNRKDRHQIEGGICGRQSLISIIFNKRSQNGRAA